MKRFQALILSAIAVAVSAPAMPPRVYHVSTPTAFCDTVAAFPAVGSGRCAAVEARIAVDDPRRLATGDSPAWFGIGIGDMTLTARRRADIADNIDDRRVIRLTLTLGGDTLASRDAAGLDTEGRFNSYALEWNAAGDTLTVSAGKTRLQPVMSVPVKSPEGATATLMARGCAEVALLVTEEAPLPRAERLAGMTVGDIDAALASANVPSGLYTYLDRSGDQAIARPGGRYSLAVVPEGDGNFMILYMGGAEVEPEFWRPGMLKGRLRPTPFQGQYDLDWYDAHGDTIPAAADSYAVYDFAARTLAMTFPSLDGATLRFALRP